MALDITHSATAAADPTAAATFFYDLASPDCYLIAERIRGELPLVCDWEPVHGASIGIHPGPLDTEALAAAVAAQGLLALKLPSGWPPDSALAMRVAVYARGAGTSIAYSLAAFRQAFAGGRDLAEEATVLLAAAACEMHPVAVLKGAQLRSTAAGLHRTGERALAAGVTALPAIAVGDALHCGPDALDRAGATVLARPR
jgi:2-hydroxychromene-2-carboxylate isomerase